MKNYIYYYFMNNQNESISKSAPRHAKYWEKLKIQGGPFSDFSGGFICFAAENKEDALSIINKDSFMTENLLSTYWLNEWLNK